VKLSFLSAIGNLYTHLLSLENNVPSILTSSFCHEFSTSNPTLKMNRVWVFPLFTTLILSGTKNKNPLNNEFCVIVVETWVLKLITILGNSCGLKTSIE
jgi:hypothetical protein